MHKLYSLFKSFVFPSKCIVCNDIVKAGSCLCEVCRIKWDEEKHKKCAKCGREHIKCVCPISLSDNRISCIIHLAGYEKGSIAQKLAFRVKNSPSEDELDFLARELHSLISTRDDYKNAIVTFVPRREKMIIETGCDQAKDIAERICAIDGRNLYSLLTRKGNKAQKELNATERHNNVKGSYFFKQETAETIKGKTVFIVDDIITTGTTVNYCAKLLIENGAGRVNAVSISRRT